MRNAFSAALIKAAQQDERVILLTGDHGYALFDEIRRLLPDRYLNVGVAEQNMVGVAAGFAKAGLRPIFYGLSAFIPVRVLEQIKLDICYEELPVVMIGDGAGFVVRRARCQPSLHRRYFCTSRHSQCANSFPCRRS